MAEKLLPGVNFDSNPGLDEFDFLHQTYSAEFSERSNLMCSYGIYDASSDPAVAPFSSARPLSVTVSPVNPLTVDVTAGYCVTPRGMLAIVDATVPNVALPASMVAGKIYIIAVEYKLLPNSTTRTNRFGVPVTTRLFRPSTNPPDNSSSTLSNAIAVIDLNDYNNPNLYTDEQKQDMVVIAMVTVLADPVTSQLSLGIDLTNVTYAFNRPWFSPIDYYHRNRIGSGLVSDRNPHGSELQDFSSGGLTLYQQLTPRGGVVSKDLVYFGYPGKFCTETFSLNQFRPDYRGTTSEPGHPPVGGSWYFQTQNLPVKTGSLYFEGEPWNPIPYTWQEGTRTILIGALEDPSKYEKSLVFEYFSVQALEPGPESPTQGVQTLTIGNPISGQEFVVSSGLAIKTLAQTSLNLPALLGPIKKKYQVLCQGQGTMILAPQPLVTSVKVQDLVNATQTVNQGPSGGRATKLIVGLTRATERSTVGVTSYDLNIKLQITGTTTGGTPVIEEVVFKSSQWKEQRADNTEEPMQFQYTTKTFDQVTGLTLTNTTSEPHNAGPDAIISVWADVLESSVNQELAQMASFFWTGSTGVQLRDERNICTTLDRLDQKIPRFPASLPEDDFSFLTELLGTILAPPLIKEPMRRLAVELDDDRMLSETWKSFSTTAATGTLSLISNSWVTTGLLIRIANGKVLRFISGESTPSNGEVTLTNNDDILRNNIIATVNDPSFDSTWFASIESGSNPPITLTRPMAYADGFMLNYRHSVTFSSNILPDNSIQLTINNGTNHVYTAAYTGLVATDAGNNAVLESLVQQINEDTAILGGMNAVIFGSSPYHIIIINGTDNFQDFTVSCSVTGGGDNPTIGLPADPFTFEQPQGGSLPAPHLPQRYLDSQTPWEYMSRAIVWEGVGLEGSFEVKSNNSASIADKDQIEISIGKIITARKPPFPPPVSGASLPPNTATGEFLVDTRSLVTTLDNAVSTINNVTFNSGVLGEVKSSYFTSDSITVSESVINSDNSFAVGASVMFSVDLGVQGTGTLPTPLVANKVYTVYAVGMHTITVLDPLTSTVVVLSDVGTLTGTARFRISETKVRLRVAGYASARLRVFSETVVNTWKINTYAPVGIGGDGNSHALIKTIRPLNLAEWRFRLVESPNTWSQWVPAVMKSPTCWEFSSPGGKALYAVQYRLHGLPGQVNAFSLYKYVPEHTAATITTLDERVVALEEELTLARGSRPTLDQRLSTSLALDGTPTKDTELVDARESIVFNGSVDALKTRLDYLEGLTWLVTGNNWLTPTQMVQTLENKILSGPLDSSLNTQIFGTDSNTLIIKPCSYSIQGYTYTHKRQLTVTFTSSYASGTYYVYVNASANPLGSTLVSSVTTTTIAAHTNLLTDASSNFAGSGVTVGCVLVMSSVSVGNTGKTFYAPITELVSGSTLKIAGNFPTTVIGGTSYKIYNLEELPILVSAVKPTDPATLILGEANWTGSSFNPVTGVSSYRALSKYTSSILTGAIDVSSTQTQTIKFTHSLGFLPSSYTLYYYTDASTDTNPKVLGGDEVVVRATTMTMEVKNRYANMAARAWDGSVKTTGYYQLVIG